MNCAGSGMGEAQNELDGSLATSARNLCLFMRGSCAVHARGGGNPVGDNLA